MAVHSKERAVLGSGEIKSSQQPAAYGEPRSRAGPNHAQISTCNPVLEMQRLIVEQGRSGPRPIWPQKPCLVLWKLRGHTKKRLAKAAASAPPPVGSAASERPTKQEAQKDDGGQATPMALFQLSRERRRTPGDYASQ